MKLQWKASPAVHQTSFILIYLESVSRIRPGLRLPLLGQWFLIEGKFVPWGMSSNIWRHFWVSLQRRAKELLASTEERREMWLNILQCTRQPSTTKNYLVPYVSSVKGDKSWSRPWLWMILANEQWAKCLKKSQLNPACVALRYMLPSSGSRSNLTLGSPLDITSLCACPHQSVLWNQHNTGSQWMCNKRQPNKYTAMGLNDGSSSF